MSTALQEDGDGLTAGAAFVPVGGGDVDLFNIKVTGYQEEYGSADGEVAVQTLDEAGRTDRTFLWKDLEFEGAKYYGWYEEGEFELEPEDVTFQAGEGIWTDCSGWTGFSLQSNGEVPQSDVVVDLADDGLVIANPTPVDVDLYNTKVTGYEEEYGSADGEVAVQTLDEAGRTDRTFLWKDLEFEGAKYYGWYEEGEFELEPDDVIVKPGQGLWTDCSGWEGFNFVWPKVVLAK